MGKEVDGFWITFLGQCSYLCTYHHCTLRSGLLRPRPPRTWRVLMVTEAMVPDFNNKFIDGEGDTRWDHEQILSVTVDGVVVYVSMCRWTTLTHNRMCMDVYALCGRHTCPLLHQWRFAAVACCDLLVQPGRKCLYVFSLWSLRNVVMTRANMHYAIWKLYLRMCGGYWSICRWTTLTPRMCIDNDARWGRHTCPAAPDKVAANKVRLGRVALRTPNFQLNDRWLDPSVAVILTSLLQNMN